MSCTTSLSTFGKIEHEFRQLTSGPHPLALDGYEIDGSMPDRPIPLDELRALLLVRATGQDIKDAAWSILVDRAQRERDPWVVGSTGVMLPGLRRIAAILNRDHPGDPEDTDSEVVLGFLECLNTIDPASRHIAGTLWWAARRRGTAARSGSYARAACSDLTDRDEIRGQRLTPPPGHPDLVLARAVHHGVVSRDDAELVSSTRLSKETLEEAAHRLGLSYQASRQRRRRAELRLLRFLGHPREARRFTLAAA